MLRGIRTSPALLLILALLSPVRPAAAQQHADSTGHAGFHAAAALGYGTMSASCPGCDANNGQAAAIMLRLGWGFSPHVVYAGEFVRASRFAVQHGGASSWDMLTVAFYPERQGGFFLKGGFGRAEVASEVAPPGRAERLIGAAFEAGAGIEARVSRKFSLTPYVDALTALPVIPFTTTGRDFRANVVYLGVAVSYP
jgi:hypothetical protein